MALTLKTEDLQRLPQGRAGRFKSAILVTTSVLVPLLPGLAHAQIDEVIVTAERRAANIQDVPIAVSAISEETLKSFQAVKTEDLQRIVPGLKLLPVTSNPSNFQVALRGSVQNDSSLVVAESPVGFYLDDVYIARLNGANAQLADLERVEVLRGPQGTLYGRNTLAGAVKLITAVPDEDTRIRASVGAGSYGRYEVKGAISGALGDNGLYGSVSALANGFDGYYTNLFDRADYGQEENYGGRVKLRYAPDGSAFEGTASVSYAKSDNDGFLPTFAVFPNPTQNAPSDLIFPFGDPYTVFQSPNATVPSPIEPLPRGETEQLIASLTLSYDLDWATFKSISAYVKTDDFFSIEFIGDSRTPVFGPSGGFPGANGSDTSQFSQEFQLQGSTDRLDWLAGVYYFKEDAEQVVALVTDDLLNVETDSISLYANGTYALSDRLNATVGARWTQDKKDFSGSIRQFVSLAPIFPTVELEDTYEAFTPKFGLDYKLADNTLLYGSVSRGFKSGGFNGIAFGDLQVLQTAYDPETNWSYEAGLKTQFADNRVRVNLAAYINDVSNVTLTALSDNGLSFPVQNAGDADIKGLEIETVFQPNERLNLFLNATLQDAKYTRLNPTSSAAFAELTLGAVTPPQVADLSLTVGGSYTFDSPFSDEGRLVLGGDHFYTDDFFIGTGNDFVIEGYSRTNAYAAYQFNDNFEARVSATNISDGVDVVSGAAVFNSVSVLAPRQVMFTLSYKN